MEKRYTEHLEHAIEYANDIANAYDTGYIGTEHILFGLICEEGSAAGRLLKEMGVDRNKYKEEFRKSIDRSSSARGYTPRTKKLFETAAEVALHGPVKTIPGTEHMLYAVLSLNNCLAVLILKRLHIDLYNLALRTERLVFAPGGEEQEKAQEQAENFRRMLRSEEKFPEPHIGEEKEEGEPRKISLAPILASYGEDLTGVTICGTAGYFRGATEAGEKLKAAVEAGKGTEADPELTGALLGWMGERCGEITLGNEWICSDPYVQKDHAEDPFDAFTRPTSNRSLYDFTQMMLCIQGTQWAEKVPKTLPIYNIAGDQDPVGEYGKGVYEVSNWLYDTGHKVTTKLYSGYRHEIHNYSDLKDEVEAGILAFMDGLL